MSKPKDPTAWPTFDGDAPLGLREAIGIANEEDGQAEQVARLAARLGLGAAGAMAVAATSAQAHAASAGKSVGWLTTHAAAAKGVVAALVIAASGVGIWWVMRAPDVRAPAVCAPALTQTATPPARPTQLQPTAATVQSASPQLPSTLVPNAQARESLPSQAALSPTEPALEQRVQAQNAVSVPAPRAADLTQEARLLTQARALLEHEPAHALRLTQLHRRLYERGALSQERELLGIRALVELQRLPEAARRSQRFSREFPTSPHARRAAEIVAGAQRAAP